MATASQVGDRLSSKGCPELLDHAYDEAQSCGAPDPLVCTFGIGRSVTFSGK